MRIRQRLTIIAALVAPACGGRPRGDPQERQVVLLDTTAVAAVHQMCSRPGPGNVGGIWRPSHAQVLQADSLVRTELQARLARLEWLRPDSLRPRPGDYYRQYVALLIGGQRVLYVNGFHRSTLADYGPDTLRWKHRFINVCDGGPAFFGAEVWLDQLRVRSFAFNGYA